jgi:DNA repair protein RecN (Recombination protein N)
VLEELRISGLGVIDEAVLPLGPGLTVLTGETGAGKTMVVTALLLLFGGRAEPARVRTGSTQATVDGRVLLADGAGVRERVEDAGGEIEDGVLLLRRVVAGTGGTGRSRAFVGGAPAPVALLSELSERLLAVHGQADQLRLTRPAQHRAALDRYAGVDLGPYAAAYEAWRIAAERLEQRRARSVELRLEADQLESGLAEIELAAPQAGEDAALALEASRLAHADGLRQASRSAHDMLLGDPDDPTTDVSDVSSLLGLARRALAAEAGQDATLDRLAARVEDLALTAADLGADLAAYRDGLDADPERLAWVEARRAVLGALIRRHGADDVAGVLDWAESAAVRLSESDVSEQALAELAAVRDAAAADCAVAALALTDARRAAAGRLGAAVSGELAGLAMADARVRVAIGPRPAVSGLPSLELDGRAVGVGPEGADEVEILLQPHPEAPELPLGRGASGGELSRVMLALEVCLAGTDPVPTMIFDEVDAGVGGRAAAEVGRRLAELSREHQVIVVTHLAQVAAFADRHVVIDKPSGQAGVTRSDVRLVEDEARIAELARMLAGTDSVTARLHAAELLDGADRWRRSPASGARPTSPTKAHKKAKRTA